MFKKSVLLVT